MSRWYGSRFDWKIEFRSTLFYVFTATRRNTRLPSEFIPIPSFDLVRSIPYIYERRYLYHSSFRYTFALILIFIQSLKRSTRFKKKKITIATKIRTNPFILAIWIFAIFFFMILLYISSRFDISPVIGLYQSVNKIVRSKLHEIILNEFYFPSIFAYHFLLYRSISYVLYQNENGTIRITPFSVPPAPRSTSKSHLLFRTLRENVLFLGGDVRRVGERKTFVPVSHGLSFDFRACLRLRQRDLHQLLPSTEEQLPREKKHAGEESGRLWWVYTIPPFRPDRLSTFQMNRQDIGKSSTRGRRRRQPVSRRFSVINRDNKRVLFG